jgi:hypothetical protein
VPAVSGCCSRCSSRCSSASRCAKAASTQFTKLLGDVFLYAATFFLGLTLGILCEANTLLEPTVLKLLLLGMLALTISALGGLLGGYILYFWTGGKYNPMIGIAGVSCVPTTAKVVQKIASEANAGSHHPAAGAGRQHQWRDYFGDHRGNLHSAAALTVMTLQDTR